MKSNTILLVEDNQDDELLALRAFRKNTILSKVAVARDGAEALDYLHGTGDYVNKVPPLPAFVLLDLNLPKVHGYKVLQRLRSHSRTAVLPVVVLTSSREACDLIESYRLGANSYIRKPVDFDLFIESVSQLESYWLQLNETPPLN